MAVQLELLVEPATVVTTAAELRAAVASGDPHIEIRRHLDLRYSARGNPTPGGLDGPVPAGQSLPASSRRLQDAAPKPPVLGTVADTLRAIRGNCTASGPVYESHARQLQLQQASESESDEETSDSRLDLLVSIANIVAKPSEELNTPCVLHLDAGLLVAHSQLWLDGLHLDVRTAGAAVRPVIETSPAQPQRPQPPPALWMTDVTVVGNIQTLGGEQGSVTGVHTAGTTVLLESCVFSGLGGHVQSQGSVSPVDMIDSKAAVVNCTFARNFVASQDHGVIRGNSDSYIVLSGPVFSGNAGPGQLLLGSPGRMRNETSGLHTFLSDDEQVMRYCQDSTTLVAVPELGQQYPDASSDLASMKGWLRGSRSAAGAINRTARLTPSGSLEGDSTATNQMGWCGSVPGSGAPGSTEGSPGQGLSASETAAVTATSAVLLLVLLAGGLLWRKRSAEMRMHHMHSRSGVALTDWARSGSKAAASVGSRDHDDSEGTCARGKRAASYEQQDMSVRHTAPAAAAQTASAALASRQANTLAATAGPADKAAYSNGDLQGKRSALAFAGACGGTALPARAEEVVGSERMRTPCHPPADLQTVGSSSTWVTLPPRTQAAPQHPGAGASVKERLAYIGKQLDAFGRRGVILKQFETLGGDDRCIGGQAVVQFVRAPRNNHLYAIKLFATRAAYEDEKHLYVNFFPGFMPTVVQFIDNEDGSFTDPFGSPMPPCFVMEKGESLTERTMRRKSDIFTTVQIIGQVASCLAELHGHGWVHRDLKPGNIMYLPRTASWTLIDFGLAARTGQAARLGFTLAYAAPEVIAAADKGTKSMIANTAVDAWALGVMAFELLTGRPMYCKLTDSPADLERQLLGEEPLPWEGDRLTADTKRCLGAIRAPVLRMLCRDPAQRASCKDLAAALRAVFSGASTADVHDGGMHASAV